MKKFIAAFLFFFSVLFANPSFAATAQSTQIASSTSDVASKGIKALDQISTDLLNSIDKNIKRKITLYYEHVTSAIIPIFSAFIVFWIIFNGIRMGLGAVTDYNHLLFVFGCMMVVWTTVFSWDAFYPYVVELFTTDLDQLIAEMTGTDAKSSFMAFVQVALKSITKAMGDTDIGITNPVSGFFFVMIYALIFGLVCIACAMFFLIIISCKLVIGVLLAIAPIFLACLMFPATRHYATNWLQAVLTPIVINLLLIVTCDLVMDSATQASSALMKNGSSFLGAWIVAIMAFVVIGLFFSIPRIAISLVGNGFDSSSGSVTSLTTSVKNMVMARK
ncbi:type IV secretion system protein [Acinetobacter pollinis]|uniref:type IV secretion system protein n=1 Tax=Acinetobacter pollinis TaxID=2605270 RepID=UPI0018A2BD22|nr:type IV secretion system protein [Acinetobacter pollinis]MBF7691176.1 type IV secretion system protein [Acinetobacter pollinis]MBF7698884.1 type IV secretion system protein [Acinetobacter pollinis]